jgi:HPt (histidine-containing phosphotransfer) domain-containing protein
MSNQTLYQKLLLSFNVQIEKDYLPIVPQLQALSENVPADAFDQVQKTNHALKGVAGNLAVEGLFKHSLEIDLLLKQQQRPTDQQIRAFENALRQTQIEIADYLSPRDSADQLDRLNLSPAQFNSDILSQLLKLKQLISRSEYIDDEWLDQIEIAVPSRFKADWQAMTEALDVFEFEQAERRLDKLLALGEG